MCVFKYSHYCVLMVLPTPPNVWRRWVMHVGNAVVPCTLNSEHHTLCIVLCV